MDSESHQRECLKPEGWPVIYFMQPTDGGPIKKGRAHTYAGLSKVYCRQLHGC
jgi:hypothetical protein